MLQLSENERDAFCRVKYATLRNRLYPVPEGAERDALDALVRAGVVLSVPATPTSYRGYVAVSAELPSRKVLVYRA